MKLWKQTEAPFQDTASLEETADSITYTLKKLQKVEQRNNKEKQKILPKIGREEASITQKLQDHSFIIL